MCSILGFQEDGRLGQGAYGQVLRGVNPVTSNQVALKLERASSRTTRASLEHEARVYTALSGGVGIPSVIKFGREGKYNILVLDLLGPSLEMLLRSHGTCFSMQTILIFAEKIITRLEFIHSRHIIHRDIKPENILVDVSPSSNSIYLIDFGLARPYRHPLTHVHYPFVQEKELVGTLRYASLNSHFGYAQSRRDDLESAAYTLIYLAKGQLPWQSIKAGSPKQKAERIREKKRTWTPEQLAEGLPPEFATFLAYARGLAFDEQPDYQYIRILFQAAFRREAYRYDSALGWSTEPPAAQRLPTPQIKQEPPLSLISCSPSPLQEESLVTPVLSLDSRLTGAYVFIKLLARPTLQNDDHVFEDWTDRSFWQSPTLSLSDWHFPWRPAMVLSVTSKGKLTTLRILPIMHRPDGLQTLPQHRRHHFLPLQTLSWGDETQYLVRPTPAWPLPETYHYNTHRMLDVAIESDVAENIRVHWRLRTVEMERLLEHLDAVRPPMEEGQTADAQDGEATLSVKRHRNTGTAFDPLFADIAEMNPENFDKNDGAEWSSSNGWLREKNKMMRRRAFEWGQDGSASSDSDLSYNLMYSDPPPGSRRDSCTIELQDVDLIVKAAGRVLCLNSLRLPDADWKSLALSHPAFRHRAQERIFRNVRLSSDEQASRLLAAFAMRLELVGFVEAMSLASPLGPASMAALAAVSSTLGTLSLDLAEGADAQDFLKSLTHAPALHTLSIFGPSQGTAHLTWTGEFPQLRQLSLARVSVHVRAVEGPFLYALSSLELEHVHFLAGSVERIRGHPANGTYVEKLVDVMSHGSCGARIPGSTPKA